MTLPLSPMGPETTTLWSSPYWGPSNVLPGGQCLMRPPSHIHVFRKVWYLSTCHSPQGSWPFADNTTPLRYHQPVGTTPTPACLPLPRTPAHRPTLASLTFSGLGAQRPGSLPEHQHQEPELAPHGGRQDPPPTRCSRALAREGPGLGGAVLGADGRRGGLRGGGGEPGQARRRERRARERAGSEQSGGGQERSPGGGGAGGAAPSELSPVFPGPSLPFPRAPAAAPQARTEGV